MKLGIGDFFSFAVENADYGTQELFHAKQALETVLFEGADGCHKALKRVHEVGRHPLRLLVVLDQALEKERCHEHREADKGCEGLGVDPPADVSAVPDSQP